MKYLKLYENGDWRKDSDDKELVNLSLEIDDILLEISDEGFPFVQPAFINRDKINVEVVGNDLNKITGYDEFYITQTVQDVLERLVYYIRSKGYEITLGLYYYGSMGLFDKGYDISHKDGKWVILSEQDDKHNTISNEIRPINLLEQEVDFIGITIYKN